MTGTSCDGPEGVSPSVRIGWMSDPVAFDFLFPADGAGVARQSHDGAEEERADDQRQSEMTEKYAHAALSLTSVGIVAASQRSQ